MQVTAQEESQSGAALGVEYRADVAVFTEMKSGQMTVYGPQGKLAVREWGDETAWLKLVNRKNRVEILVSAGGQKWQSLITDFDVSALIKTGSMAASKQRVPRLRQAGSAAPALPTSATA